jgi:integrase/recombinase XerD
VVTVHGKGSKTRSIFLGVETWNALVSLRENAPDDAPVFVSQMDRPLSASQMYRIVRRTAELAGVKRAGSAKAYSCLASSPRGSSGDSGMRLT